VRRETAAAEEVEQGYDEPEHDGAEDEALAEEPKPDSGPPDDDVARGPGGTVPATATPEAGQTTEEWGFEDDEELEDPDPEEPDEDVLEETPEFLQETPEHDRLWFEQRPPRDFDFDG
jgi:hypothetical protein